MLPSRAGSGWTNDRMAAWRKLLRVPEQLTGKKIRKTFLCERTDALLSTCFDVPMSDNDRCCSDRGVVKVWLPILICALKNVIKICKEEGAAPLLLALVLICMLTLN